MKLTVWIPFYREPVQSVWATVTNINQQAAEFAGDVEVLLLDNCADSAEGAVLKRWCEETQSATYHQYTERVGTAITRDECYRRASGEWVMVIDAHVQLFPGALHSLVEWIANNPTSDALVHGPLCWIGSKNADDYATELTSSWGLDGMKGQWYSRKPLPADPFPIYAHGMGLSACRREAWPWSCADETYSMVGFGGEEGHVGELFHKLGRPVWCLPRLRWAHCFLRTESAPYGTVE